MPSGPTAPQNVAGSASVTSMPHFSMMIFGSKLMFFSLGVAPEQPELHEQSPHTHPHTPACYHNDGGDRFSVHSLNHTLVNLDVKFWMRGMI